MTRDDALWSGRFSTGPAEALMRLTASIDVDIVLLPYDIAVTKAHVRSLEKAGLLDADAVFAICDACDAIVAEVSSGQLQPASSDEDVHSFVERVLTERLGDTGKRIHAGRSRNDLVATDLRLWCIDATRGLRERLGALISTIADRAEEHAGTVMPGYTHLQRAQPVSLGFHLAAHGFALLRDGRRLVAAHDAADVSALGAGALATTTLDIDPAIAAGELGFSDLFDNAMDAVADRDFVVDLAYAAALCCVHLSRLAEEVVLWTSSEFGFATLDDAWSTGSSMMPQKRNPDVAELVRGRAGRAIGDLTALLAVLKGLPLAYDRDLQEDKQLLFGTVARTLGCLEGMTNLIATLTFDEDALADAARTGGAWATDLAERLVSRGVPFRDAHARVGALVRSLEEEGRAFADLDPASLTARDAAFEPTDLEVSDPGMGLQARNGPGGPAPERVLEQIEVLRAKAKELLS